MNRQIILLPILVLSTVASLACSGTDFTSGNGMAKTKGFFHVEQVNDRWRFVDPDGTPFFSTGMCSLSAKGNYAPALGYSPYHENIMELYGSEEIWAQVTRDRMDTWGFNTIASGDQYIKATEMPYTLNLGMAGANWQTGEIPDYFSGQWLQRVDRIGREVVAPLSEHTELIGYFLDNELHWGPDWRKLTDLLDEYCAMPSDSPGKGVLVRFLQDRYEDDVGSLNLVWRTHFESFDELFHVSSLGSWLCNTRTLNDRAAFNYVVAEQYFRACHEAIRRYDRNHLILGARFQSWLTPLEVAEACAPFVDVVSANQYFARPILVPITLVMEDLLGFVHPVDMLQEYYEVTGRPVLISEFHFRARDSGLPNTKPSSFLFPVLSTQSSRAECFQSVARRFIQKPYAVGYHWFAYSDQPETGRFDGENSNIGVVNEMDEPYEPLVSSMANMNRMAQERVRNPKANSHP